MNFQDRMNYVKQHQVQNSKYVADLENDLAEYEGKKLKTKKKKKDRKKKIIKQSSKSTYRISKDYADDLHDKYGTKLRYIKNMKYRGNDVVELKIHSRAGKHFSIGRVQHLSNKLSRLLGNDNINASILTTMDYGKFGWRSGFLTNVGNNVPLFDPTTRYEAGNDDIFEVPKVQKFNIYIPLKGAREGGADDKFNDCLYDSLKYYIFNLEDYYKSGADLKKKLGLGRYDKVPIEKIDMIEKLINRNEKIKINIKGKHIRMSEIKAVKEININLINGHYSPVKNNIYSQPWSTNEKKIILYDKVKFIAYDGEKEYILKDEEYKKLRYSNKQDTLFIWRFEYKNGSGEKLDMTMKEEYDYFIETAEALKIHSNGLINLYKSGSYFDTCLKLFDYLNKCIKPEEILSDEAEWIQLSGFGAHNWANVGYEGELHKCDAVSLYPSSYTSNSLKFPVKRGEFKTIEEFSQYIDFGIYRAEVKPKDDNQYNNIFKFNKHNFYTCIDLQVAKKYGFEIALIQDGKPNFLYYSPDKLITFKQAFDKYFNILFPLKEQKLNQAKFLLNLIWGVCCQIDKRKIYCENEFYIEDNEEIFSIKPLTKDENKLQFTYTKINNIFKSNYARLKPFMIANGRKKMTDYIEPHF